MCENAGTSIIIDNVAFMRMNEI